MNRVVRQRTALPATQRGVVVLLMLLIVAVSTASYFLVKRFNGNSLSIERDKITAAALAQAKAALIGFAVSEDNQPGGLPCPDTNNDGNSDSNINNCISYIGHLPWRKLGIEALRDGNGECLWYAISPVFRNVLAGNQRNSGNQLNSQTNGTLTMKGPDGNVYSNTVIALIFSPGSTLYGQNRSATGNTVCGGNNNPSAYLDTIYINSIAYDNATGSGISTFISAEKSSTFNDKLIAILPAEFFPPIKKRIAAEVRGLTSPADGLEMIYSNNSHYPWASSSAITGIELPNNQSGYVPYVLLGFGSDKQNWLKRNGWFALASYNVTPDQLIATINVDGVSIVCNHGICR